MAGERSSSLTTANTHHHEDEKCSLIFCPFTTLHSPCKTTHTHTLPSWPFMPFTTSLPSLLEDDTDVGSSIEAWKRSREDEEAEEGTIRGAAGMEQSGD